MAWTLSFREVWHVLLGCNKCTIVHTDLPEPQQPLSTHSCWQSQDVPSHSITKHSALTCEDTWCKGYGLSRPPRYSLIILMTTREFFAFSEAVCKTPVGWWSYGNIYSPILIGHDQNPLWEIHGNPHSSASIKGQHLPTSSNLSIQHTTHPSSQAGPPGKTLADLWRQKETFQIFQILWVCQCLPATRSP